MGILLEADYKSVIQGKESIWGGLSRAFSAVKMGSRNPLERKPGEELRAQEKDGQLTYELMNRDSGLRESDHNGLIFADFSSYCSCPGICREGGRNFCLHLRRWWSTDPPCPIYQYEEGG